MTYKTIMVHLNPGHSNAGVLQTAGDLAQRFEAAVIGIVARQPTPMIYPPEYQIGDFFQIDRDEIDRELQEAESAFRSALQGRVAVLEWRSSVILESVADFVAREARSADLIVTCACAPNQLGAKEARGVGSLVMQAGRPIFLVSKGAHRLATDNIILAWKDTREARRAATDALPFLKMAKQVSIVEVAADADRSDATLRLANIANWLTRHGVISEGFVVPSKGEDAGALSAFAHKQKADLLVAGAYGHSRLREWALGGVTRDLLTQARFSTLLSH
jgi:nucleotide-binding universal stress UspA family protein